jgi:hypothetical protein
MKTRQPTPLTRVRLYSHVTKTRFLHVEDALSIGKVRLFAGTYDRGQGMSGHTSHYLDVSDARIVFHALLNGEQGFNYKEYKGTPPPSPKQAAVSRVLSVAIKGDNVYIELKSGPGQLTPTGAITPNGRAETEVNIGFKLYEARRLGATALAYIHAWDVMRMLANKHAVSPPLTYLMVPTAAEANGHTPMTTNGQPPVTDGSSRPITRHGPTLPAPARPAGNDSTQAMPSKPPVKPDATNGQTKSVALPKLPATTIGPTFSNAARIAQAIYGPEDAIPALASPVENLHYADGTAADMSNEKELQTFRRYLAEMKETPASKSALQAYFRQQKIA